MNNELGRLADATGLSSAPQIESVPVSPVPASIPSAELFNYTSEQFLNIRMRVHPDCCQAPICTFCGASEDNFLPCRGDMTGLALDLFQEAACCAHNANIKSIGQMVPWKVNNRQGRAFDAAARFVAASAIEAGTAETGTVSVHESAGLQGDAQTPPKDL